MKVTTELTKEDVLAAEPTLATQVEASSWVSDRRWDLTLKNGATVQLPAAVFRNKHISIIGQSVFVAPIEVRRTAYTALAQAALDGAISLDTTSARLDEVAVAWRRLAEGAPEKQIVVP